MTVKVECGDYFEIVSKLPENSIDMIYTCPSPYGYYHEKHLPIPSDYNPDKVGSETNVSQYLQSLVNLCDHCKYILKPTGSLFIQLGDQFGPYGNLMKIPLEFERMIAINTRWFLSSRLFWHRTEMRKLKNYKEKGFLKNYEYIFHFVKDSDKFYFNTNSKYSRTSVFSYPLEDSYYTNEFDSGLPTELFKMVIDTTTKEGDTVLDPLAGSGKLGVVAKKMNRNSILIDSDVKCCELMRIRLGLDK